MSNKERDARIRANMRMQEIYLENRQVFDETVLYTGRESLFDLDDLQKQFEDIIRKRKLLEKSLNNQRYVALPYNGGEPYLFFSYSHQDTEDAFAIMSAIQRNSFRVWYDDGIEGGANWKLILKEKISHASAFILLISPASVQSSWVQQELTWAQEEHLTIFPLVLSESSFESRLQEFVDTYQKLDTAKADFEAKITASLPKETRA